MKKNGFTLVELLIVMAIIVIMAIIMIGIFNATGVLNKARDAQRKKDIGRIKVAFEEYHNDKGCYPNETLVAQLSLAENCGKIIFSPWLSNWPCDPNKEPYKIVVEEARFSLCNKWYKIMTQLENKKDAGIPSGWESQPEHIVAGAVTSKMINFGVASPNINWYDAAMSSECAMYGGCYYVPGVGLCNSISGCVGPNCYVGVYKNISCSSMCQVSCCGTGCN